MSFYSVLFLEKWNLASSGLKIKLWIFRVEHVPEHFFTLLLCMDKTPTARHRGMRNVAETTQQGAWKICKKHSRKMGSCSDMIMPMNCQALIYHFH